MRERERGWGERERERVEREGEREICTPEAQTHCMEWTEIERKRKDTYVRQADGRIERRTCLQIDKHRVGERERDSEKRIK